MDIKRLFQIPLIFLLIPLFFLVMLIKIYILQYIIINRIAVWGGSFWMVLFLFCLPALEVLLVWEIIVYCYGWKVREKLISSSYSRGDILVLYQAVKSWDTAYLGGVLLDAAITAVEAMYFLVTPLFLFLPWILYDVIVKWFGLSAVIFGGDLGF